MRRINDAELVEWASKEPNIAQAYLDGLAAGMRIGMEAMALRQGQDKAGPLAARRREAIQDCMDAQHEMLALLVQSVDTPPQTAQLLVDASQAARARLREVDGQGGQGE